MVGLFQTSPVEVRNPPLPKAMLEIPYLLRLRVDISFLRTAPFPVSPLNPLRPTPPSTTGTRPPPGPVSTASVTNKGPTLIPPCLPCRRGGRGGCGPSPFPRAGQERTAYNGQLSSPSRLSTSIHQAPDIPCPDPQKHEPLASRGGVAEIVVSLPLLFFSNVSLHCGETPPPAPHPIHPSVRERRRRRTDRLDQSVEWPETRHITHPLAGDLGLPAAQATAGGGLTRGGNLESRAAAIASGGGGDMHALTTRATRLGQDA